MKTTFSAHIGNTERNVGIDVGKAMLDVMILETDTYLQEPNSPEGIKRLVNRLSRYKLTRIIVEATGGYEHYLVEAIQHNTVMKRFYQKLVAQGKHRKVAINAYMRKMMTILNAMVRDNREWQST